MEFNPGIHTKEFLLKNPNIALRLIQTSANVANESFFQDFELISMKDTIAHELAISQPDWATTEAAQNFDVLSLTCPESNTVAHLLAFHQPQWTTTKATQSFDVLSLRDGDNMTVAHELARKEMPINTAKQYREKGLGWQYTEASRNKDVLLLHCKSAGSVAQVIACKAEYSEKYKPLLSLIKSGAAYATEKESSKDFRPSFSVKDIEFLLQHSMEAIQDEQNEVIQLRMVIAIYSTFRNLEFDINAVVMREFMSGVCSKIEETLEKAIEEKPQLFTDPSILNGPNCAPGAAMINHHIALINLQQTFTEMPPAPVEDSQPMQNIY